MEPQVKDQRQLVSRFWMATLIVTTVLGGLLWKKQDLIRSQSEIYEVVALTTFMARGVEHMALLFQDADHLAAAMETEVEHRGRMDRLDDQMGKLHLALQQVKSARSTKPGSYKGSFAAVFFDPELGLSRKFDRYLAEAAKLVDSVRTRGPLDRARLAYVQKDAVGELTTAIDTVRSQSSVLGNARLSELEKIQVLAYGFILTLFLGIGVYIIFPTKRLLESQNELHDEAVVSLQERNAELALSRENLGVQKRILQSVLDSIGEAVVVFRSGGAVMLQNPAALRLFPDGSEGAHFDDWTRTVGLIDTETGLPLSLEETPIAVSTQSALNGKLMEIKHSPRTEPVYVTVTGQSMVDEAGNHQGAVLSFHDVTDRVRSEMELRRANTVAEAASRSKSEFLANISHEIRTPMTAILGYADLLLINTLTPQQRQGNLQVIRRNGRILMKLIDDILDISKIEAGKLDIEKRDTSLQDTVSEIYSLLSWRAREKNIRFTVNFEGSLPKTVYTAPERLRQVLINVVGNAIKFTEVGEVNLTIRLSRVKGAHVLEFLVKDTGVGFPPEAAEKLFAPFVQVDTTATRRFGGSGLGLALSKRLANALGGDLQVEYSAPGKGSIFIASIDPGLKEGFSVVEQMALKDTLAQPSEDEVLPSQGLEGFRILVVEDSPENRELFVVYLEAAGAKVTAAKDGREGTEKALSQAFDLVLMDVQMPRMDGYQAVSVLRKRNYPAPVIALTAHAMEEEKERCRKAGFDDFLTKPIDPGVLVRAVKRAILVSRAQYQDADIPVPAPLIQAARLLSISPRIQSILDRFVDSIPVSIGEIKDASEKGDWEKVLHLTHRFKGTAGNCGFSALRDQISRLEDTIEADPSHETVPALVQELEILGGVSADEFKRMQPPGES